MFSVFVDQQPSANILSANIWNIIVNGHAHGSSQSMTSCVTKMAISRRSVCCFLYLYRIWTHTAAGRAYRHMRLCAVHGWPFQCLSSLQQWMDLLCCFLRECNQVFLHWKASIPPCRCEIWDAALHSIRRHLQTNPTTSTASFAPLQLPYTIMVYGLNPYIREYFTREYFNTTASSNREFKNAKNAKIANPRNINPAKIKWLIT